MNLIISAKTSFSISDFSQVPEIKTSNICGKQYIASYVSYVYPINILMPNDIK